MKPDPLTLAQLRDGVQRLTRPRLVLLEELRKVRTHPSADAIHRLVRKRLPRVSFGTVYRNLGVLKKIGLIQELKYGKDFSRYDGNPARHYHVTCERCGQVEDLPLPLLARMDRAAAAASGYTITGHRLEFLGVCRRCR